MGYGASKPGERLAPRTPGVRLNIGLAHYAQGHYEAASEAFESLIHDDPTSVQAHYLLGMCYFLSRPYDKTIERFDPLWKTQSRNLCLPVPIGRGCPDSMRRKSALPVNLPRRARTLLRYTS